MEVEDINENYPYTSRELDKLNAKCTTGPGQSDSITLKVFIKDGVEYSFLRSGFGDKFQYVGSRPRG